MATPVTQVKKSENQKTKKESKKLWWEKIKSVFQKKFIRFFLFFSCLRFLFSMESITKNLKRWKILASSNKTKPAKKKHNNSSLLGVVYTIPERAGYHRTLILSDSQFSSGSLSALWVFVRDKAQNAIENATVKLFLERRSCS